MSPSPHDWLTGPSRPCQPGGCAWSRAGSESQSQCASCPEGGLVGWERKKPLLSDLHSARTAVHLPAAPIQTDHLLESFEMSAGVMQDPRVPGRPPSHLGSDPRCHCGRLSLCAPELLLSVGPATAHSWRLFWVTPCVYCPARLGPIWGDSTRCLFLQTASSLTQSRLSVKTHHRFPHVQSSHVNTALFIGCLCPWGSVACAR